MENEVLLRATEEAVGRRESYDSEYRFAVPAIRFQLNTFHLLGVRVDNITGNAARRIIQHYIEHSDQQQRARKVFFTNVHSICTANRDWITQQCINNGDLVLPDGSGLKMGGFMTSNPITENLNGTDFTPTVLKMAEEKGWSVYLFGAKKEVVEKSCEFIRVTYPNLKIAGSRDGFFTAEKEEEIINQINAVHPDILLVALGTPLQEKWLTRYAYRLNAKVCMAVGGLFDFISETRKRAPKWMRAIGIEWLFRFIIDPKEKWKRVLVEIPMFFSLFFVKQYLPQSIKRTLKRVFSL